jgi:DNA helicase HerA-like ATPase
MNQLMPGRDFRIKAGTVAGAQSPTAVELGDNEFATHMAVYGGTGKGKSKFLELILRQIIDQRRGACIIDPHGDLVEDLLLYIMQRKDALDPRLTSRIHYFDPGSKNCRFSFDPFRYRESADGDHDYDDWLKAKVESVAKVVIRKQGESDFAGRPRLERFLNAVLYGVGTRINERGDHLPLADAEILLTSSHPYHKKIAPLLPPEVLDDFKKVWDAQPRQQEEWAGSTINRLRSFLSPAVKSLFADEAKEVLDFRSIVEQQGIMLVNLRRTRSFTLDQSNAIGGLFINEILEAVETADRTKRTPFFLFIDEASRFIGQDLIDALAQFRKYKLSLCLAVQDLSSLKGKEIDMGPKVMSQCGIQVTFQQKFPDDVETFANMFGVPDLDFTRLVHEVDRPDGYEAIETTSTSYGDGKSTGSGTMKGSGWQRDPDWTAISYSTKEGTNDSTGRTENSSVTHGTQYLGRTRVEQRDMGRLQTAIMDQLYRKRRDIATLGKGEAMVLIDGANPFILKVHQITAPFSTCSPEKRADVLEKYKVHICRSHPYSFSKSENPRLSVFLDDSSDTDDSQDRDDDPF